MHNQVPVDLYLQRILKQISKNPSYCVYKQCTP